MLFATLLVAALACARVSGKALLHEVPYYLPGVSDIAYTFEADEYEGRAFRVFGVDDGDFVYRLTWEEAEQACLDVGIGLATAMTPARKAALDRAVSDSDRIRPPPKSPYWVGIYRATLSDPKCLAEGAINVWPYFIDGNSTSYEGCGKDEIHDWVWSRGGGRNESDKWIYWRDQQDPPPPAQFWESEERTGVPSGSPQPTGWSGDKTLGEDGGKYENCTVGRIYGDEDPDVFETARNIVFWRDYGCTSPVHRWVCEFESVEQSVDEAAIAARPPDATATSSPYFIPGVSDLYREVQDGPVMRVLGTVPSREPFIWRTDWAFTWGSAQRACIAAGAQGLATNPSPEHSVARGSLIKAVAEALFQDHSVSGFSVWMGGATTLDPATAGRAILSDDFLWYPSGEVNVSEPLAHQQWYSSAYPVSTQDAFYIDDDLEEPDPFTSCIVSVWDPKKPSADARWQNVACNSADVQYFLCAFDSVDTGMATMTPSDDPDGTTPPGTDPSTSGDPQGEDSSGIEDSDDDGTNVGAVVGGAIAGLVLLAIIAALVGLFVIRRRRRRDPDSSHGTSDVARAMSLDAANTRTAAALGAGAGKATQKSSGRPGSVIAVQAVQYGNGSSMATHVSDAHTESAVIADHRFMPVTMTMTTTTDTHSDQTAWQGFQGSVPSMAVSSGATRMSDLQSGAPMMRLEAQLDGFAARGDVFARKYVLGPSSDRRRGGQGVVQFGKSQFNGYEYAIKFFLSTHAFVTERALYKSEALQRILPNIEDMADPDNPERDHLGQPLPPYIVMERGEALDEWSMRANPDMPTTVTVLSHLAARLADLHKADMVHRDLKPGNVMWLPRENRWTIIDFGCVANVDTQSPISYSLSYAAPEVIKAVDEMQRNGGPKTMLVKPSLDAWSIGVMLFRMLTAEPGERMRRHIITVEQLRGDELLPWEGSNLTPEVKRRLGVLKKPTLKLLSRDPKQRPSMATLKALCDEIFAGKTTHESIVSDGSVGQF